MTDEQSPTADNPDEVPREEWPRWCAQTTSELRGRDVVLRQSDRALGEVRLAAGQQLVAIEHDEFGNMEALTIKCGSVAVPVSYVVAAPRSIRQQRDQTGAVHEVSIVDATGRRTFLVLS